MQRIFPIFVLFALAAAGFAQQPAGSVSPDTGDVYADGFFTSRSGGFSIEMPAAPMRVVDHSTENAKARGIDTGRMFVWTFERTLYTLFYSPPFTYDGEPGPQTLSDLENGTRSGIIHSHATLVSEKPIKLASSSGTEFRYDSLEGMHFISRVFLVGQTGYQIVGAYRDDGGEKEVRKTLDSFTLTAEWRPSPSSRWG